MISTIEIERLIAEDAPSGDLTTDALGIGDAWARMLFRARGDMVPAGLAIAARIIAVAGGEARLAAVDGTPVEAGSLLIDAAGSARSLHTAWKCAQTLVEAASGIATATAAVVAAARMVDPGVRVACTRKTFPGGRLLSQIAVRAGGGILHRHGLSETILVFAEHRAFLGQLGFVDIARHLRRTQPEKAIGIEVGTVAEAIAAAEAGFDTLQLEKFTPADVAAVAEAIGRLAGENSAAGMPVRVPVVAAAGGISPDNAGDYVRAGARLIVTSWPYSGRPRDVAVTLQPARTT